jgi:hypothetical protein
VHALPGGSLPCFASGMVADLPVGHEGSVLQRYPSLENKRVYVGSDIGVWAFVWLVGSECRGNMYSVVPRVEDR